MAGWSLSQVKFERRFVDAIERGDVVRPGRGTAQRVISADLLRRILIGAPIGNHLSRAVGRRCTLTAAGIVIDGGRDRGGALGPGQPPRIVIRPDEGSSVIDLSNLARADGNALPPLILRNCEIDGVLRISGSHFAAFGLSDCALRKLDADGVQIDSDCRLVGLRALSPLDSRDRGCCQVRLVAARIDGTLDLRRSVLRSPAAPEVERLRGGRTFADRFALSLASSEIAGRLLLIEGFVAEGGVSLFQAAIKNSVRIANASIAAHHPTDRALDASELNLEGSLFWLYREHDPGAVKAAGWSIAGSANFIRSQIGGDLHIENIRWRMNDNGADPVGGGVDLRYARLGGQLRFTRNCRVARQHEVPSGLRTHTSVRPALDCWKASFRLGFHLHSESEFAGPVLVNACHIERDMWIAAKIGRREQSNALRPFVQVLDLSDTRLQGLLHIDTLEVHGRASFQRLHVDGAFQVRRLGLHPGRETSLVAYRDTSVLDFQDMCVRGIVDFAEGCFSVTAPGESRTFIVDLRGMTAEALDDADGTCWNGLSASSARPWRLRYDGIAFDRIEKSTGKNPALSGDEIIALRVQAIQSFFRLRPNQPRAFWRRALLWLRLLFAAPSDEDRELRQFSPQAHERFARGYAGRGDVEVAVGLIVARSNVQWLLRVRSFARRWWRIALAFSAILVACGLAVPALVPPLPVLWAWPIIVVLTLLVVPVGLATLVAAGFRYLFGYGLMPRRAIATFCGCWLLLFVLLHTGLDIVPVDNPRVVGTGDSGMEGILSRLLFAFDSFVPADLGWKGKYAPPGQGWPRIFLGLFEILGWIVTSMTILTISGVLKRDIER